MARGGVEGDIPFETYVEAFNVEVRGLRAKTEVWCHTCWGNPFAQRLASAAVYKSALAYLDRLDVDVITVEAADNGGAELADVAAAISNGQEALHRRRQPSHSAGRIAGGRRRAHSQGAESTSRRSG